MSMDLLTTIDIMCHFSNLFKAPSDEIKIADISTDREIPAHEVHINIYKGRLKKLSKDELKFIKEHKLAHIKLVIIRRNRLFRFWHQEV
jgi:hypothetical protein